MKVEIVYEEPVARPVKEVVLRFTIDDVRELTAPNTQRSVCTTNSVAYEAWLRCKKQLVAAMKAAEVIK